MSAFLKRFSSGALLIVLLAAGLIVGGWLLLFLLLFTSLCGLRELYQAVGYGREKFTHERYDLLPMCGYYTTIMIYAVIGAGLGYRGIFFVLIISLLASMVIYVRKYPFYEPVDFMSTIFGVLYIPLMLSAVFLLRNSRSGIWNVWLVFLCSWVCDTCAYCVGSSIGKNKLAPVLSPKKSLEGAIGGVIGSILACGVFALVFYNFGGGMSALSGSRITSELSLVMFYAFIGLVGSVFSQFGDLTASAIKRHYGIKDYGTLIPGHGGILDRFDSVIVTAPLVFLLLELIG